MYIILTENSSVIGLAKACGEKIFDIREAKCESIAEPKKVAQNTEFIPENIEHPIANFLVQLGIPASIKGFDYIKYALKELLTNPDFDKKGMTKGIYAEVGNHFETTAQKAERAIRHAIEVVYDRSESWDLFNTIFGYSINANKGKPTNSEFLYCVKNYLERDLYKY